MDQEVDFTIKAIWIPILIIWSWLPDFTLRNSIFLAECKGWAGHSNTIIKEVHTEDILEAGITEM